MQLENRFTIPVQVGRAWDVLLDVERVIPCFPGASVAAVTDDKIDGSVRIKLGPVLLHYAGTATFVEKDASTRRVVLAAQGSDRKGGGSAAARITAGLHPVSENATECRIVTDLDITGRPAQFGRGIMTEVGNRITGQFAANLSAMLTAPTEGTRGENPAPAGRATAGTETRDPGPLYAVRPAPEPLDLLQFARGATVKRLLPVAAAIIAVALALRARHSRRRPGTRRTGGNPATPRY